jgi:RNA polymerase sigma factor (sigma-70 family)
LGAEKETYISYSAEDLLVVISMADDDPQEAEDAFHELVNRFRLALVKYCSIKCKSYNKEIEDAIDIVWNAFYKIKNNPTVFDLKKANTDDVESAVLAYLKGIVKKEFYNFYSPNKKIPIEIEYEVDTTLSGDLLPDRKILKEVNNEIINALKKLNWKQREVFLAYREFSPLGEYLPREVGKLLCETLNLTNSTLRVYNKRAKETLQQLLSN